MMTKNVVNGRIDNKIRIVALGIPKWEKYESSMPLLNDRYDIPPRDAVSRIMRIAFFVSKSDIT